LLAELTAKALIADPSIYFVDDGSSDGTWGVIERLVAENACIHGLKLSRNFGQQSAILAGLLTAPGDILISIDADLQDDVAAIEEMVNAYTGGADIVYGIRRSRQTDSFFKRTTAEGYYRLLQSMGVELMFNHADFRLLSRRVVTELRNYKESNLLLRGLIPQLGFSSALVYYDRQARFAGETNY
jgi:glycosyltransferase involved in cell wall biosynthesis